MITNNAGLVSVDGGLILIKEFLHQINFQKFVDGFIPFREKRSNSRHSFQKNLELVLLQLCASSQGDKANNELKDDPAFNCLLESEESASQPTVSRFWNDLSDEVLTDMEKLIDYLNDGSRFARHQTKLVIDIDSTHFDTFVKQEAKTSTMATIRHRLLKVAVKIVRHVRKIYYNLSTSHVYGKDFFEVLTNIQNFQIGVP